MPWALRNLWTGLLRAGLWIRLAFVDIQTIYRRSLFGLAWIAFSFGLFIFVKILIFGGISSVDTAFFALWVTVGYWVWTFLASGVIDGCNTFIVARGWILGTNLPLSVYIYQTLVRTVVKFAFALPVVVGVMLYFGYYPKLEWLWVIPGLLALVLNSIWVNMFFGSVAVRHRDLTHLMTAIMQVTFFLTPILYVPSQFGKRAVLFQYNPFTHYIAIVREPLINAEVPIFAWKVVGLITVIGWIGALIAYQRRGRAIPFWV